MAQLAERLDRALRLAGFAIEGVSIGDPANRRTWLVRPNALQASCQATIDAFNPDDPAIVTAELDARVRAEMDDERLMSAVVWCVIDTFAAPATRAKYLNARTKILDAYKTQPWKP